MPNVTKLDPLSLRQSAQWQSPILTGASFTEYCTLPQRQLPERMIMFSPPSPRPEKATRAGEDEGKRSGGLRRGRLDRLGGTELAQPAFGANIQMDHRHALTSRLALIHRSRL